VSDPDKQQTVRIRLDEELDLGALRALNLTRDDLLICRHVALDDAAAANLALQCRLKTIHRRCDMPLAIAVDQGRIEEFCREWRVKELSIFGSALGENFRSDSDVDVLVELQPGHGLSLYDWVDMVEELEAIFQRKVDLVAKGGLKNPFRRREILRTAEVLYAS